MNKKIELIEQSMKTDVLLSKIINIWEKSVRATHDFITVKDLDMFKLVAFSKIKETEKLIVIFNRKIPLGFMVLEDATIELLFMDPKFFGFGYGKRLVRHAIKKHDIKYVDVNEQNTGSVEFYKKQGFEIDSRSEKDDFGNPYPILHLALPSKEDEQVEKKNEKTE